MDYTSKSTEAVMGKDGGVDTRIKLAAQGAQASSRLAPLPDANGSGQMPSEDWKKRRIAALINESISSAGNGRGSKSVP